MIICNNISQYSKLAKKFLECNFISCYVMLFHVKRKTFYFLKQVSGQDKTGSTAKQNSKSLIHSGIELFLDEHFNFHTPLTHQFSFHELYMGQCKLVVNIKKSVDIN